MNYSTAVMLINPNIRAVKTSYEKDTPSVKQQRYIFKTLDTTIAVGDYVVVPTSTRHNMTVVKVEEVDVEVDFENDLELEWIVDKVNVGGHQTVLSEEAKWIEALKASEKRRKREDIKKNMMEMYQDSGIEKLAISNMVGVPDVPAIEQAKE